MMGDEKESISVPYLPQSFHSLKFSWPWNFLRSRTVEGQEKQRERERKRKRRESGTNGSVVET